MPTTIPPYIPESIADWEGRHRLLMERHKWLMQQICDLLNLYYPTTNEMDIVREVKSLSSLNKSSSEAKK